MSSDYITMQETDTYKDCLDLALKRLINDEAEDITVETITPSEFLDWVQDLDKLEGGCDDIDSMQGFDWWVTFMYDNHTIDVFGNAYYGTVTMSEDKEEE